MLKLLLISFLPADRAPPCKCPHDSKIHRCSDTRTRYWGGAQNKRFGHSGDNLRHLMRLGRLQGGEYRDPHFIFNFESESFRDLAEECCSTMLMAPMKNSMPVWIASSAQAQRIRNYVSNGNHMIFTGGSLVRPVPRKASITSNTEIVPTL